MQRTNNALAPLLCSLLVTNVAATQASTVQHDARQSRQASIRTQAQELAKQCQTMVGFRLGHLMSLSIQQVTEPTPPATTWAVIGEDKGQEPAINFICQFKPDGKAWQLEKLDLLQVAPEKQISSAVPVPDVQGAPAGKHQKG